MVSDTAQDGKFDGGNGLEVAAETPTLSWTDAHLRQFLAEAWDQHDASHIQVIGRLDVRDGTTYGFLKDLHHAGTGIRLRSALPGSGVHESVFVAPDDLLDFQKRWGTATYAVAELELSPLQKRHGRGDPLACMVRTGTLGALSHIPASWGIQFIDSETVPLIVEMARVAIDERLTQETVVAEERLHAVVAAREKVVSEHRLLDDELKRIKREINEREGRIDALDAEATQRRETLVRRYRELEAFFMERGERMVALDLVDRADLEKLFPPADTPDSRTGHSFAEALGGDLQRLVAYVQAHLWRKGMHYTRAQLRDFITLLRTNDLIVLAGDSGSGKTSLVKSVASAIGAQCTIVPVKPNWTGSEDLLGYYNPIEGRYHPSQFLLALLDAARDPDVPHFICLDEMNLARVEYYFADFLSLLETRGEEPWIHLYSSADERQAVVDNRIFLALEKEARKRAGLSDDVSFEDILMNDQANLEMRKLAGFQESDTVLAHHARIRRSIAGLIETPTGLQFPRNVWIIGAINVDETTHYLSPKILDRAHVMRFRNPVLVDWDDVEETLEHFELDLDLPVNMQASDIGIRSEYPPFDQTNSQVKLLVGLARDYLDPLGIEFGLRAIRQSIGYIQQGLEVGIEPVAALNNIALHKILPKIVLDIEKTSANGTKRREVLIGLRDALAEALAGIDESDVTDLAVEALDQLIARAEGNNGIANFWAR